MTGTTWIKCAAQGLICCIFLACLTQAWAQDPATNAAPLQPATTPATVPAKTLSLKEGDRIIIGGDSITEQRIYSRFMEDYFRACAPQLKLWVIQSGWSGELASGYLNRMDMEVSAFKPTVFTTCWGMNDGGYRPFTKEIGDRYYAAVRAIVCNFKQAGVRAVVGSPGAIDTFYNVHVKSDVYNPSLKQLALIDSKIAADAGMVFADLHDPMMSAMEAMKAANGKETPVCGRDGIHPGPDGHLVMAYAFLKALGFSGDIGTFTVDLSAGSAKVTDGHKLLSFKDGAAEIESTRYPFCFPVDANPDSARAMLPFIPFNQDLNRLMLVVTNLKTDKAKVTWGAASKTFTKEQLAKGVNLAAEFLDNPFSQNFASLDARVAQKQAFETIMVKQYLRTLADLSNLAKDDDTNKACLLLQKRLVEKSNEQQTWAQAAVTPVKHTITIAPE